MDDAQRAQFAEKGWFAVPDAVTAPQLEALNAIYEAELAKSWDGRSLAHGWANGGMVRPQEERWGYGTGPGTSGRVLWGQPYYDLIDNPRLVPILEELLGDPRWHHALPDAPQEYRQLFFMDHDNSHFSSPFDPQNEAGFVGKQGGPDTFNQTETWTPDGLVRGGIHGGQPADSDPASKGQLGSMITVVYELQPVAPGCGGTACLSGTHNAAFPRPDVQGHNLPPWPDEFGVELATVQPGGALVFTETMLHSTFPYSGQGQRRTLFYKYHPYGMDRRAGSYTIKYDLDPPAELGFDVTDAQRRILAWPEQWDEYGLGDYGPGVPTAGAQEQTVSKL